jgi:hypothetical protein
MPRACVLYSAKVIIITFALCNTNSKNETEEGYLVLSGTTPKMMVYPKMMIGNKVGEYESSETMFRMLNAYILHVDHV